MRTAYCRLLVLLEIIVDESEDERALLGTWMLVESYGGRGCEGVCRTFPTAASPSSTSFTDDESLGLAVSAMMQLFGYSLSIIVRVDEGRRWMSRVVWVIAESSEVGMARARRSRVANLNVAGVVRRSSSCKLTVDATSDGEPLAAMCRRMVVLCVASRAINHPLKPLNRSACQSSGTFAACRYLSWR